MYKSSSPFLWTAIIHLPIDAQLDQIFYHFLRPYTEWIALRNDLKDVNFDR